MSIEDVLAPLRAYARGHATGDIARFRAAFWPSAHVEGARDSELASMDMAHYESLFDGRPADDEAERSRTIDHVEVHGTVATATMTLHHGEVTYTDMFVLLQVGGEWRIANKVYHRHT